MKLTKFHLAVVVGALLGQGCAATSPGVPPASQARMVDLGNGICRESNGRMWQVGRSEVFASGREAEDYARSLELGGHDDWRLPSKEELYELCYLYELRLAGDCPLKLSGSYWSSDGGGQAGEWQAYPLCGGPGFRYLKSKTGRARGVRP